jgi:hypothetical protein
MTSPNNVAVTDLQGSNQINIAGDAPHGFQPNGQYLSTALFGTGGQPFNLSDPPLQSDTFNGTTFALVNHMITTTIPGAGIDPILEPGLKDWTVYLDVNHNGVLDAGEPSAVTNPDGTFTLSNVPAGTYTLSIVGQQGWDTSTPTGGSSTITLNAGQTVTNVSFGETQLNVSPAPRQPTFTSTPPTSATVGTRLRYNAAVANPDGTTMTFDLMTHPAGMVVDPTLGVLVWIPTPDEIGAQSVVLRVRDTSGRSALQSFTVQVTGP